MRGLRRGAVRATMMALVVGGAAMGSTAPALADTEPNNVISQAEGPVGGGVDVVGSLSTPDDHDFYVFYAASQQQLHLTADDLTNPDDDYCLDADFVDTNGALVDNDHTTPPGVNRYFVRLEVGSTSGCSNPQTYRFRIDPAGGVTGGPALDRALSPTGEPNETPAQAAGPLQAAVNYIGTHDTVNDEDWFFFWAPPGPHQLDLSVTAPANAPSSGCSPEVSLYGGAASDSYVASAYATAHSFGHINQTLVGPDDYFVRAGVDDSDCLTGGWQFRIETPDAVTLVNPFAAPPPPPPPPPVAARPARPRYATSVSLRRRGARYSGRASSARLGCKVGRRVVLRRFGSGSRSFGSTRTRSNGTFSIQRSRRLRGRVYASVTDRYTTVAVCRGGRSRSIRG